MPVAASRQSRKSVVVMHPGRTLIVEVVELCDTGRETSWRTVAVGQRADLVALSSACDIDAVWIDGRQLLL
jgi:hypothetical protein